MILHLTRRLIGLNIHILLTQQVWFHKLANMSTSPSLATNFSQQLQSFKLPFYSIEIFPPSTESGLNNLKNFLSDIRKYRPLFCAITSKSTSRTSENETGSRFELARMIIKNYGFDILLHLTCSDMMDSNQGRKILSEAKKSGIKYIFALQGDNFKPAGPREFNHAIDIVKFIRKEFSNDFIIAVAGYPDGHPSSPSFKQDIAHLKAKVDAGADIVISQFFFNVDTFAKFVRCCRSADIKAPILPGIFTFSSYKSFTRMINTTKVPVSNELLMKIESKSKTDQQIKQFAIKTSTQLCLNLVNQGLCPGLHFFSLNQDASLHVIEMVEPMIPRTTINQQLLRLSAQLEECVLQSETVIQKNASPIIVQEETPKIIC